MESSAYPMLFSPIKVGTTEVKNRVFMPPVSTNLADHGYVTDDLVDHYRARAKGGVGLIITEVVTVEPTYTYLPGFCRHDECRGRTARGQSAAASIFPAHREFSLRFSRPRE